MIAFVFFILFVLAAIVALGISAADQEYKGEWRVASGVLLLIGVVLFLASSLVEISTKNVGVVTEFGKPTGELSNGLHFKAPWATVTEMDAAIQTDVYTQANESGTYPCLQVHIAYQIVACADVSLQWRIDPTAVEYLFKNYRGFSNIQTVVDRDLSRTLNEDLSDYDPLTLGKNGQVAGPSLSQISGQVTADMAREVDQHIIIESVYITILNYDGAVQASINKIQQQYAATRTAEQQILTNEAQAKANDILAQSLNNDPGVLESKCLDGINNAINSGYNGLPAGYSCLGTSSAVVVPAK
jgi:regulator of protease activity HflC (stomatin/prohibitin superfamily)